MRLSRKALIVSLIGTALVASACSSSPGGSAGGTGADAGAAAGGDLVMARADEPSSLIPSVPTDNASIWTMEEIYDTLLVPSQDGLKLEPSLATKWEQSADKLSWTFTLRDGATFSDGKPVTSADVKFSIDQNRKEEAPFYFLNAVIKDIKTPDDKTIVFTTKVPWSPLPSTMALYANSIVPKDYGGKSVDEFNAAPIGSGPFAFDHWTKGSELKLVKNAKYWDTGKPLLDSVTFTVVADSNTRSTQLAGGQSQINEYPPYSTIKGLQAQPNVKVTAFPSSEVDYFGMNTSKKPFDDVNVRQAVAQAIDKEAIRSAVLFGNGEVATTFLSPATWGHSEAAGPTFDVTAAKATLAKSAYPDGFKTTLTTAAGNQNANATAQLIQSSLAKIGIQVTLQTLDPSALRDAKKAGNYEMGLGLYTTDVIDPDEIARFAGTNAGGSQMLYTFFTSDELTKLADAASADENQATRKKSYDAMQQIVLDQAPYVPLYYAPSVYSYSNKVQNFHPGATGNYFLKNVSLAP
ncbi:ABC transporter substrate-binding protein [Terracoccus luteus]|uniref:Peptide/nickel transport system substrate-binding protein n=1 Tax=Terracoccus luteus TaxID=53356 RepID=A0A839Q0M0_9MICO|nr:ABC transporter substrate-binding protein [Terracoccus luteus]MBB2986612.1 peptide/nickel transport system substrate-binding protein [Terracoccus luteus]MCP2171799.1 peptide/nickel transport system substrate-binding protein [Terracoccus luteus]